MIRFIFSVLTLGVYPLLVTNPASKSQVGKVRQYQYWWRFDPYGTPSREKFEKVLQKYFSEQEVHNLLSSRIPETFFFDSEESARLFQEDIEKLGLMVLKSKIVGLGYCLVEYKGQLFDLSDPDLNVCEDCNKLTRASYDFDREQYFCQECGSHSGQVLNRDCSKKEILQYAKKFQKFLKEDERFNDPAFGSEGLTHTG